MRKNFGEIALKVVKNGCYYGYKVEQKEAAYLQELPVDYCRSRYKMNGKYIVEFNIKYFDDIPPVVSVSEAAGLARKYSTETSADFVNGVLSGVINK